MPSLEDLSIEQQHALRSAAANLHREFEGVFGTETIELFLTTSYDQFAASARIVTYLPLMAERFARQRLKALAGVTEDRLLTRAREEITVADVLVEAGFLRASHSKGVLTEPFFAAEAALLHLGDDLDREVARLADEGVRFRNEVVTGPGGAQVLAVDPSGNFVELFQPAAAP